jgi:Zn-dependent oligopeptidase
MIRKMNWILPVKKKSCLKKPTNLLSAAGLHLTMYNRKDSGRLINRFRHSLNFGDNIRDETNSFELVIDNEEDLSGLPDDLIATAAEVAV